MITNQFNNLLSRIGEEVLVNDVPMYAVITNPPIKDVEQRYFHSTTRISQGSIIKYGGESYLTLTESRTQRHDKFKAVAEWCNNTFTIQGEDKRVPMRDEAGNIVLDRYGKPIMITVKGEPTYIPCIVKNVDLSIAGKQLVVPNDQIEIRVQKNDVTKAKFKVNGEFLLVEKNWKIVSIDYIESGIMKLIADQIAMPAPTV